MFINGVRQTFIFLLLGLHTMGDGGTVLGGFGALQLGKPVSLKDRRVSIWFDGNLFFCHILYTLDTCRI